jgi:hypothetical protein
MQDRTTDSSTKTSCDARPDHTLGQFPPPSFVAGGDRGSQRPAAVAGGHGFGLGSSWSLLEAWELMVWWAAEGREIDRARRALCLQRQKVSGREDPFAAIIRCTADPAKADKRTRSKWSRVMRYATAYKPNAEALDRFIRRKGGINACAARPEGAPAGSLRATRGSSQR